MRRYGTVEPLYSGAMAKGIASADLVIAMGGAGLLASFGAGGLPLDSVERGIVKIKGALGDDKPYAVNLIHSPFNQSLEQGNVELFLKHGVRTVEASAFMNITEHVVRYKVAGLFMSAGGVVARNRIIAKLSRTELAEAFMSPAPEKLLQRLLGAGHITTEQAEWARTLPLADDIAVEADSGGHTDNRPMHVILPLIIQLRDKLCKSREYARRITVGVGGGIGCPAAVRAAFAMGAAFVLTGTINQLARESGTCDFVRKKLSEASYADVTMAPAADMFDQGVELQVLKKGSFFPTRAKQLYAAYRKYPSIEAIPAPELLRIETKIFQQPVTEVWAETKRYYVERLGDPSRVVEAEKTPKLKMSMIFRWYLSKSSNWANTGDPERRMDYQIWCGPSIGSYNEFAKGSNLDPLVTGVFPSVVDINLVLMERARTGRDFAV